MKYIIGLILSVLIFTNLIGYIKNTLHISIILIIYLYFVLISVLCEVIEDRENKWLKIFLVNNITIKSVILNKLGVTLLNIIKKKNNIDELIFYFNKDIEDKINILQVGYTWYIIDSLKNIIDKPIYNIYYNLRFCIEYSYLVPRIDEYIFFKYYKWDVPCIVFIKDKDINQNNIYILKNIMEYDYEVFKMILFLYWDLEYYLLNFDNVKNSLIVDSSDSTLIRIKFSNEFISNIEFIEKLNIKILVRFE